MPKKQKYRSSYNIPKHRWFEQKLDDGTQVNPSINHQSRMASSSNPDSLNSTQESDIPGFYYDSQKKKYFRILPSHNNRNAYTMEQLEQKQTEEARQKYLAGVLPLPSNKGERWRRLCKSNPFHPTDLIERRRSGFVSNLEYRRNFVEHNARSLSISPKLSIPINNHMSNGPIAISNSPTPIFMQVDSSLSKLLVVLEDVFPLLPFVRTMTMHCVDLNPTENLLPLQCTQSFTKHNMDFKWRLIIREGKVISKINWADGNAHILVSIHSHRGATVRLYSHNEQEDFYQARFLYRCQNEAWTCEWCHYSGLGKKISLGCSEKVQVIDVESSKAKEFATESGVMSQKFSNQMGVIFNGMRNGKIFGNDLRCNRSSMVLEHGHTVVSIQLLNDQNYLLSSSWNNQIWLWDVRATKVVREFKEHINSNKYIPLHIDSTESIVYSAGQDTYIRLWNINSGELLKTIPPPNNENDSEIPLLAYSQEWLSGKGPSGLLSLSNSQLHWYG